MVRFGVMLALVPLLVACKGDPQTSQRSELEQAAYELQLLQNGNDMFAARFANHPTPLVERMAWFRAAIGTCDGFELYRSHGPKQARFLYHCERGQLEARIGLGEDGRVKRLLTGARGVAPPERVRTAAERWLESPAAEAEAKGCRIDRVHLGSQSGALFVLVCPTGEKTLLMDLDHSDVPRRVWVVDDALDEWRVPAEVG